MKRTALASFLLAACASPTLAAAGLSTVGRDLVVEGQVPGRVVAVLADVRGEGRVAGDVAVWGGDLSFGPGGSVGGNIWVLGGEIVAPEGRPLPVAGTVAAPGRLLEIYLAETRRAPWAAGERAFAVRGLRVLALSLWLLGSLLLLFFFSSPYARAAARAEQNWSGALFAGVLGVLTLFLAAATALTLLPAFLSVPLSLAIAAVAIAAKIFGMGALFLLVGQKLVRSVAPPRRPVALTLGFLLLGAISLIPLVGPLVWSAASILAVGIAFASGFGTPRFRVAV
ncbi:MAG: hypothetical protein ABR576_12625 [Thermoanaerobaculia bacterium]